MNKDEKKAKILLINSLNDNTSDDYDKSIKNIMDEKKHVAVDYRSSKYKNIWPNMINYEGLDEKTLNNLLMKSYFSFSMFYIIPFVGTSLFSIFLYPRFVFISKRILKFKSFMLVNSSCALGLMYFNVKVFSLLQTYTGFYIIKRNYNLVRNVKHDQTNKEDDLGFYYHRLKSKIIDY